MDDGARRSTGAALAVVAVIGGPWAAGLATQRDLAPLLRRIRAAAPPASPAPDTLALDTAVLELSACALLLGACWLSVAVAAGVLETLTGSVPALLRAVAPAVVRRGVALACGVTLGTASAGLSAHAAAPAPAPVLPDARPAAAPLLPVRPALGRPAAPAESVLSGLELPERQAGDVVAPGSLAEVVQDSARGSAPVPPRRGVVVRGGDSLWRIAEDLLPDAAGTARVDRAWRLLYAANRDRVGADPDLVHPGTSLRVPRRLRAAAAPERPTRHHSRREAP